MTWKLIFLNVLFWTSAVYAQPDTTRAAFFPMHDGDYWEYEHWLGGPVPEIIYKCVAGDSTYEGVTWKRQITCDSPSLVVIYKITSDMEVWRKRDFDPVSYRHYDLDAEIGEVYDVFYETEPGGRDVQRIIDVYDDWLFPYSPHPFYTTLIMVQLGYIAPSGEEYWGDNFDILGEGIGLVAELRPDGGTDFLRSAEINGVQYGYPPTLSIEDDQGVIERTAISLSNYPNPFMDRTTICWQLTKPADLTIRIYDLSGREVRVLRSGYFLEGTHQISWDGRNNAGLTCASGIYFYALQGSQFNERKRLTLIR